MRSRDWNTLGYIGLIIGVFLLAGGYFAYNYAERAWYYIVDYPYRYTAFLLFLLGGIFCAIGVFLLARTPAEG